MGEETSTLYILAAVCIVAVLGLGLSVASLVTNESVPGMMGGGSGMMGTGGGTTGPSHPGVLEWSILLLSIAFFAIAVVLLVRGRGPRATASPPPPMGVGFAPTGSAAPPPAVVPGTADPALAVPAPVPEPTLVKLLDQDERRMYLEIRDHGGAMLQRDLVASRMFSKAKVTRVLDKLEAKGLVVREAHGMTNQVRLTNLPAR